MAKGLEHIFETCEQFSGKLAALVQIPIYSGLALYGEHLQKLASTGIRPYDWWTGHLSDLFGVAAASSILSVLLADLNGDKYLKIPLIGYGLAYSLEELAQKNCDPQDIACYWAGATLAYFGTKKLRKPISNFLNKQRMKPLEEINE
ncbi:hypothetical protein HZA97_08420 [Candidatus Woesearchaeota archaeon]|nr:hypothetical protein [Candidatus Woesearchaeota archaeon]